MKDEFVIVTKYAGKSGRFLCYGTVVANGNLIPGAKPLLDLSDNALYADFLDALRDGTPLPEASPRRFREDQRPALKEAFERFESGT
jgi:hypothetical protein